MSTVGNQITVVAFQPVQLAQVSFLQKNQTLQNVFLISVTEEHSLPVTAHRFGLTLFSPGYSSPVYL